MKNYIAILLMLSFPLTVFADTKEVFIDSIKNIDVRFFVQKTKVFFNTELNQLMVIFPSKRMVCTITDLDSSDNICNHD